MEGRLEFMSGGACFTCRTNLSGPPRHSFVVAATWWKCGQSGPRVRPMGTLQKGQMGPSAKGP